MNALPKHKYTLEEYFALAGTAEGRLEFWDGEAFDTSGDSKWHYAVEGNFLAFLKCVSSPKVARAFPAISTSRRRPQWSRG